MDQHKKYKNIQTKNVRNKNKNDVLLELTNYKDRDGMTSFDNNT